MLRKKRAIELTLLFLQRAGKIPLLSKVQLPAALQVPSTDHGSLYSGTLRAIRAWFTGDKVTMPAPVSVGAVETKESKAVIATTRGAIGDFMFLVQLLCNQYISVSVNNVESLTRVNSRKDSRSNVPVVRRGELTDVVKLVKLVPLYHGLCR